MSESYKCVICGKIVSHPCAITCSEECRKIHQKKYAPKSEFKGKLPSGTVGAIQEMRIAIDFLSNGYYAFRSLTPNSPFDIVAFKDKKILKVEVTTGYVSKTGKIQHPKSAGHKGDVLAIVLNTKKIVYIPELKNL